VIAYCPYCNSDLQLLSITQTRDYEWICPAQGCTASKLRIRSDKAGYVIYPVNISGTYLPCKNWSLLNRKLR
jgi:hypothetical protein